MIVRTEAVWLDYGSVGKQPKLLQNLSAIAWADPFLWTASDEGRTIECLKPHHGGYRLHRQVSLDEVFKHLPGKESSDEADIESIDLVDGRLWICGSHCVVRRQAHKTNAKRVDPRLRIRKSRRLLGCVMAIPLLHGTKTEGQALPFSGKDGLRRHLAADAYLGPFIDLPSKENGLDIEGMVVVKRKILLGMRGPLVDSIAIVVELPLAAGWEIKPRTSNLHFLDLGGLGVRDLARWDESVIILAGPVSATRGPFRLYLWSLLRTALIQKPALVYEWDNLDTGAPEGICRQDDGLLVVYDVGKKPARIKGNRFRADRLTGLGLRG